MSCGSPPTKRLKTQTPLPDPESPTQEHPLPSLCRGDEDSVVCGICLSKYGTYIQGQIDSCEHYFCFVCIMEWAKVESKCPMCKRRFSSITRPRKDGIFYNERVVSVPKRDQVYDPHGIGSFDPYAETKCSICHRMQDECFLLLCDLCDTAAHSYCVGLGFIVPSGDWYCHDCNILRAEQSNAEETDDSTQHVRLQIADSHVSIMDVVRESSSVDYSPSANGQSSASCTSAVSMREAIGFSQSCPPAAGRVSDGAGGAHESDGRTLRRCRDVHNRIRALRENWGALQHGSLNFSSSIVDSVQKHTKRRESIHLRQDKSCEPSSNSRQLSVEDAKSDFVSDKKRSSDTDKAWKMLDIAKKKQQASKISTKIHHIQTSNSRSIDNFKMSAQHKRNGLSNIAIGKSSLVERQKESIRTTSSGTINAVTTKNSQQLEMPSSIVKANTQINPGCEIRERPLHNRHMKSLPSASYMPDSSSMISMSHSVKRSSASLTSTPASTTFFSQKLDFLEEGNLMKPCARGLSGRDNNAKSEIQSLVKLNLKLLTQHNRLGVDAFKEIARVSTHTILAAYGLEKPKMAVPCVPSSVCSHAEGIRPLHKSTLMPNSCRACFYAFVRKVVDRVLSEKVGSSTVCRQ